MPQIYGKSAGSLPTRNADGSNVQARSDQYGGIVIAQGQIAPDFQAVEGSHFACLPTPVAGGTGTAMGIQTAFSDTANIAFMLSNGDSNMFAILDYIRFRVTAAGATTTSSEVAIEIDNTNRYSSGGSTQTINNNSATAAAPSSICTARIGTITAASAGGRRRWIGHHLIRQAAAPCWIVNDTVTLFFGNYGVMLPQNVAMPVATTAIQASFVFGPAAIPPGGSLLVHIANVANATTAPSLEWEAGWYER